MGRPPYDRGPQGAPGTNQAAIAQGLAEPGVTTFNNIVPIVGEDEGVMHFLFCNSYARVS